MMEIDTTVTDPEALTKPYHIKRVYGRHRDWTLAEYVCQENNRNSVDESRQGRHRYQGIALEGARRLEEFSTQ